MIAARARAAAGLVLAAWLAQPGSTARAAVRWAPDEFVIGGYYATAVELPAMLERAEAVGIRYLVNGDRYGWSEPARIVSVLDSLRREHPGIGLRVVVDYRPRPAAPDMIAFNPNLRSDASAVRRRLSRSGGLNSPSVAGWVLWDEPWTDSEFDAVAAGFGILASSPDTRGHFGFVNLLPAAAHARPAFARRYGRDKASAYRGYLRRYLGIHRSLGTVAPYLCVDSYPFQLGGHSRDHFLTLGEMARAAREFSSGSAIVRTWLVVQLSPYRSSRREYPAPDAVRIRWQVSSALAYGVTGIWYWTLAPAGRGDFGPGLVDAGGDETPRASHVREINAQLRALGPLLLRLEWLGTRHQRRGADEGLAAEAWDADAPAAPVVRRFRGGGGDGLVGVFRHRDTGEAYLWVANKSLDAARSFGLELHSRVREVSVVEPGRPSGRVLAMAASAFQTPVLPPGGGLLLRVIR